MKKQNLKKVFVTNITKILIMIWDLVYSYIM